MRRAEGIAVANGELKADRADGRLFTDGPPDRFTTAREAELTGLEEAQVGAPIRDITDDETAEMLGVRVSDAYEPEPGSWDELVAQQRDRVEPEPEPHYWQMHYRSVETPGGESLGTALFVTEFPQLPPDLDDTIEANGMDDSVYPTEACTLEMAHFYARLKAVPVARIAPVLAQVGLGDQGGKRVGALSGGMKQRLALGLALLSDPPVLVMDEPTSNLDTAARSQLLHLLLEVKRAGKTIIFSSHRIEEVETLADRVAVMEHGRLQFTCTAGELARRVGLRTQVKFLVPGSQLDQALAILQGAGLQARRNGVGVIVDVAHGEKARPIHTLGRANIEVIDFELE